MSIFSLGIQLTAKDLPALIKQLKKHASKWREIGVHLGFLPGELFKIETHQAFIQGAPLSYLGALPEELILWAPEDSRGSTDFATIEFLKTALNEAGLGAATHNLSIEQSKTIFYLYAVAVVLSIQVILPFWLNHLPA